MYRPCSLLNGGLQLHEGTMRNSSRFAAVVLAGALLGPTWALTATADDKPDAKKIFEDQKCNKCHRVSTEHINPIKEKEDIVDLSGIGAEHDQGWFKQWLKKEVEKDSKLKPGEKTKHKGAFKGTDPELDALTGWLKSLTKMGK